MPKFPSHAVFRAPVRSSVWSGRSSAKLLFVKSRIAGIGIVEHYATLRKAATLIQAPGRLEARCITRFENETRKPFFATQNLNICQDLRPNALPANRRYGEHPLNLAQSLPVYLERPHAHSAGVFVARN